METYELLHAVQTTMKPFRPPRRDFSHPQSHRGRRPGILYVLGPCSEAGKTKYVICKARYPSVGGQGVDRKDQAITACSGTHPGSTLASMLCSGSVIVRNRTCCNHAYPGPQGS